MTFDEIQGIVNELGVPQDTNIFYDIDEVDRGIDAYIVDYWIKNKSSHSDEKLLAIIAPQKFLEMGVVYFLENGVIISKKYIAYDEISVVGTCEVFHDKTLGDDSIVFLGDDKFIRVSKNQKAVSFALEVIDKIIDLKNNLLDIDTKIAFYMELMKKFEGKTSEIIIYKKLTQMTEDYSRLEELIGKFGYTEYLLAKKASRKKRKIGVYKTLPIELVESMTVVLRKKADKSIANQYRKMNTHILRDCYPYLKIMQKGNVLYGYSEYVICMHNILVYASEIDRKISDELIYTFNTTIEELKHKIEQKKIEFSKDDNLYWLAVIKYICEIYQGRIVVESKGKKVGYKYSHLKNLDKAEYWLNLYVDQTGSDGTAEYKDVMLGLAYIYKYGTAKIEADECKMIECLKTAANHGSRKACKELAEYYIEIDSQEKDKWIRLAKENGHKLKDKRSINDKMKSKVGIDLIETAEAVENVTNIGRNISGMVVAVRDAVDTVNGIALDVRNEKANRKEAENRFKDAERNSEKSNLEHEQYIEGQRVKNIQAKAKNMKVERKANKAISEEIKKRG